MATSLCATGTGESRRRHRGFFGSCVLKCTCVKYAQLDAIAAVIRSIIRLVMSELLHVFGATTPHVLTNIDGAA